MMKLIPDDLALMTAWHLGLFLPAWRALTLVPAVRGWMRGRLEL